jgi:diaminohydroxyphosphoribosylaminopyrimidine deaminase/5-amino-6-(5-phosphoribosylamino)uracil reductase
LPARADERQWPESVRTLLVPEHNGHLDLVLLMMLLGKQQINSIWVEAGHACRGAAAGGLVDELIVYIAPKLLGNAARGCACCRGLKTGRPHFKFNEIRQVGPDVCLHLTQRNSPEIGKQCAKYYDKIRPLAGQMNPKEEYEHY